MNEPVEAALFTIPPALTPNQEEQFRQLDREGPLVISEDFISSQPTRRLSLGRTHSASTTLQRVSTRGTTDFAKRKDEVQVTVDQLVDIHTKEGFKIVSFERGTGEDPREWSKGKKWCVPLLHSCSSLLDTNPSRFITVSSSILCLAVALGSSIITGE